MKQNGKSLLVARGLGWFSIGFGAMELLAPRWLSRTIGVDDNPTLLRLFGAREVASGIAILAQENPGPAVWSRVGGDAMDLASLGLALSSPDTEKGKTLGATLAVAGVTALDAWCAWQLTDNNATVRRTVTVNRSQEEVYQFWRDTRNLTRFMKSINPVKNLAIVRDTPKDAIEWGFGSVRFTPAPGRRGTQVTLELRGVLLGHTVQEDLRRFKQLIETGEIATTEGQPFGPSRNAVVSRVIRSLETREVA